MLGSTVLVLTFICVIMHHTVCSWICLPTHSKPLIVDAQDHLFINVTSGSSMQKSAPMNVCLKKERGEGGLDPWWHGCPQEAEGQQKDHSGPLDLPLLLGWLGGGAPSIPGLGPRVPLLPLGGTPARPLGIPTSVGWRHHPH